MKTVYPKLMALSFLAISAAFVLGLSSCQKSTSTNNNGQPQVTNDCINYPSTCNNNVYNQGNGFYPYGGNVANTSGYPYGTYGYQNGYPYNSGSYYYDNGYYNAGSGPFYYMNNAAYLCQCPSGTVPTYNTYGGLGCVNSGLIGGYGYAYFGWGSGQGTSNNQWVNIPQVSNYTGYSNQNCYNGVVQSCIIDQANTCASGYTCRANSASSRLGLCVSNNSSSSGSSSGQIYR